MANPFDTFDTDSLVNDNPFNAFDDPNYTPEPQRGFGDRLAMSSYNVANNIKNAAIRGWLSGEAAMEIQNGSRDANKIADIQRRVKELAPSQDYQLTWDDNVTPAESWKAFARDPVGNLGQLLAESLGAQTRTQINYLGKIPERTAQATAGAAAAGLVGAGPPGAAAMVAPGALVGAGTGFAESSMLASYANEYANSYLSSLEEAGVDIRDQKSLQEALDNPQKYQEAAKKAQAKAVPIGVFDGISSAVAGRLFTSPAKTVGRKAIQWGTELLNQMVMGGAGEAVGQIASEGEITSPRSILAEVVAEPASSIVELGIGRGTQAILNPAEVAKQTTVKVMDDAAANADENNAPLVAEELAKQAEITEELPAEAVAPEATEVANEAFDRVVEEAEATPAVAEEAVETPTGDERFAPPVVEPTAEEEVDIVPPPPIPFDVTLPPIPQSRPEAREAALIGLGEDRVTRAEEALQSRSPEFLQEIESAYRQAQAMDQGQLAEGMRAEGFPEDQIQQATGASRSYQPYFESQARKIYKKYGIPYDQEVPSPVTPDEASPTPTEEITNESQDNPPVTRGERSQLAQERDQSLLQTSQGREGEVSSTPSGENPAAPGTQPITPNATQTIQQQESPQGQYQSGTESREATEASSGNSPERPAQEQEVRRVKLRSSPQTYTVVEELPQSELEVSLGEKYFRVRNERTGREEVVEQNDMQPVGLKGRRGRRSKSESEVPVVQENPPEPSRPQSEGTTPDAIEATLKENGFTDEELAGISQEEKESMAAAFGRTATNPSALRGLSVPAPNGTTIEEKKQMMKDLLKLGVMAKEGPQKAAKVLRSIARDSENLPEAIRRIAETLQRGDFRSSEFEVINNSDLAWGAAYDAVEDKIWFNVGAKQRGPVSQILLHEFGHNFTLMKIRGEQELNKSEREAVDNLKALYERAKTELPQSRQWNPETMQGEYGMSSLEEFVSEVYSNPEFQAALDRIPASPNSKRSILSKFWFEISKLFKGQNVDPNSVLTRAIENAFTLSGVHPESSTQTASEIDFAQSNATADDLGNLVRARRTTVPPNDLSSDQRGTVERYLVAGDERTTGLPEIVLNKYLKSRTVQQADREELLSAARQGLITGVRRYDPSRGSLEPWLAQQIKYAVQHEWANLLKRNQRYATTVDQPAFAGEVETRGEQIAARPEAQAVEEDAVSLGADILSDLNLSERDQEILIARSEGKTLRQIGEETGISYEMVRKILSQIETNARRLLRDYGITDPIELFPEETPEPVEYRRSSANLEDEADFEAMRQAVIADAEAKITQESEESTEFLSPSRRVEVGVSPANQTEEGSDYTERVRLALQEANQAVQALGGVNYQEGVLPESPAMARSEGDGAITILFDPAKLQQFAAENAGGVRERGNRLLSLAVGEEITHAAHLKRVREYWRQDGRPNFNDFLAVYGRELTGDIERAIQSSPDREALQSAWDASLEIYPATKPVQRVFEFLRHVAQLERMGEISEQSMAFFSQEPRTRDAVESIREASNLVRQGALGGTLKADLQGVADALQVAKDEVQPRYISFSPAARRTLAVNGISSNSFSDFARSIYQSGMSFGQWAKMMLQQFGDGVRNVLRETFNLINTGGIEFLPGRSESGMALAPGQRRSQVAGERGVGQIYNVRRMAQSEANVRERLFNGFSEPSESATTNAWNLIERMVNPETAITSSREANEVSGNDVGTIFVQNELLRYATTLAAQGDRKMLTFLLNTINTMEFVGGVSTAGAALAGRGRFQHPLWTNMVRGLYEDADRQSAGILGGNKESASDNLDSIRRLKALLEQMKLTPEEAMAALENQKSPTGKTIGEALEILMVREGSIPDPHLQAMVTIAQMAKEGMGDFTFTFTPEPSESIEDSRRKAVEALVKAGLTNYRDKLVETAGGALEKKFWQTLSNDPQEIGPLAEIDAAQNNALATIVNDTLTKMGLKGKSESKRLTPIQKVASILNKNELSAEKTKEADERIRKAINERFKEELDGATDPDQRKAIGAHYTSLLNAWDSAMGRMLDMPVNDAMMRRLIGEELKEAEIKLVDAVTRGPRGEQAIRDQVVRGISDKLKAESWDGRDYATFEKWLGDIFTRMVDVRRAQYEAAQAKARLAAQARNTPDAKAQAIVESFAKTQSDTPMWETPKKNAIRDYVRNNLSTQRAIGSKEAFKTEFVSGLQALGVTDATADRLAETVWREHQIIEFNERMRHQELMVDQGPIGPLIDAILNTPLADQQNPDWISKTVHDWLRGNGLSERAAKNAGVYFQAQIEKRMAEAQEKAAERFIKNLAPWQEREKREPVKAKSDLDRILQAVRTRAADPSMNFTEELAKQNGWSGFTPAQFKRMSELDKVISDDSTNEHQRALAVKEMSDLVRKTKIPSTVFQALPEYYVANALSGIPTALINITSPAMFIAQEAVTSAVTAVTARNPMQFVTNMQNLVGSLNGAIAETKFALTNDVYSKHVNEFLETQGKLQGVFESGKRDLASSDPKTKAKGVTKVLMGMMDYVRKVLSTLDQAAVTVLDQGYLGKYGIDVLRQRGFSEKAIQDIMFAVADSKNTVYRNARDSGMSDTDAQVAANDSLRTAWVSALDAQGIPGEDVATSAINDALGVVGRKTVDDERDIGTLSYYPMGILEAINGFGQKGPIQSLITRAVFGFFTIPARVTNKAAWFSPYGLLRLAYVEHAKRKGLPNRYAASAGNELQIKQRQREALAGTAIFLASPFFFSSSGDDDDKDGFGFFMTGNGPPITNKAYRDAWLKKFKPWSLHVKIGKAIIPINIGRGGEAFLFPLIPAAVLDDYRLKDKTKDVNDQISRMEALGKIMGSLYSAVSLRSAIAPLGRVSDMFFNTQKTGSNPLAGVAGSLTFTGKTLIPVIGASITRNISDLFSQGRIDRSSATASALANIPVAGPLYGYPAINALGDNIDGNELNDKLFRLGIPAVITLPKSGEKEKLYDLIREKAQSPTTKKRTNVEDKLGRSITDKEWYDFSKTYGEEVSRRMLSGYPSLKRLEGRKFKNRLNRISDDAEDRAYLKVFKTKVK